MTARLTEHEAYLDDRETTKAILNSQNAVVYEEITGLINSFDDKAYTNLNNELQ